jgi:hypothetical protein
MAFGPSSALILPLATVVGLLGAAPATAQVLPSEPISIANGRLVVGAEVTATIGPSDPGFFNYTDYEYNALQNIRVGVTTELRASQSVQVLAEVRVDHGRVFEPYGLFVRIRPWSQHRLDIQAGLIPPTFGSLTRTAYGTGNVLIGQPLAHQYLLSIRSDSLPANADDLLRMRGRGWLSDFPVGDPDPAPGLPIVNTSRRDTGVQVHGAHGWMEWTGSVTIGSLSEPRVRENNGRREIAARIEAHPSAAFQLGVSLARGGWLDRSLDRSLPLGMTADDGRQQALGADASFSAGAFLIRTEVLRASWTMPAVESPRIDEPLIATSGLIEGRYKVMPGLYLAARGDRIDFSYITGTSRRDTWEAPIWRFEGGFGWSLMRNVTMKGVWQRNRRQGGRVQGDTLVAAQLLYWF